LPGAEAVSRTNDLVAQQRAELDRLGQKLQNDINPAWARYQQRMQNLQTALDANRISQREFNQLAQQAGQQLNESAAQGTEGLQRMQQAADQLGFSFSSAFEDAIVRGEELSSVLQGLAQDIARIAIRTTVTQPLGNAFSDLIGGIDLSGLFGDGGTTTGAAVPTSQGGLGQPLPRAAGGPVEAGQPYVVGERGRELFVPQSDGRITPNSRMGGGDVTVQVINQGQPLQVESTQRSVQPDGRTVIRTQVRQMMREEVNSGGLDREMAVNFGVRRQGRR
jgi:hypothetical protein